MMTLTADELNIAIAPPPGAFIIPMERWHLIRLAEDNATDLDVARMQSQALDGCAFTAIVHGKVAACWGLVLPWRGLAEGWLIAGPAIKPVAVPFTYGARKFCDIAAQSLQLRRIQIHVKNANVAFMAWARAAKFKREALLAGYAEDGADVWLMAKTYGRTT
jgi:hypothetical protein